MKLRALTVLLSLIAIVGCGETDSSDPQNQENVQVESVRCTSTTVEVVRTPDGEVRSQIEESLILRRKLRTFDAGQSERAESEGIRSQRVYILKGDKKDLTTDISYVYTGTRSSKKQQREDGAVLEVGVVETFATGRDGYQFTDDNGQKSPNKNSKFNYESLTREENGKSIQLLYKLNGEEIPLRDEVTSITFENGVRVDTTTLQKPYSETFEDLERITESFTHTCRTEKVN